MKRLFPHDPQFYFFIPAILLFIMMFVTIAIIRDTPAQAGSTDSTRHGHAVRFGEKKFISGYSEKNSDPSHRV